MLNTAPTSTDTIAADLLDRAEQAWNAADGAAFGALFADGGHFVDIRGGHHRGKDAIGEGHQQIFDTIYAGSTIAYRLETAEPLGPSHILAIAGSTLEAPTGPLRGTNHARATLVLAANGDRWEVTAYHNTIVAEGR